jgi:hypothetical protein
MSELELSLFHQRSHEALRQKARRGALFLRVAAGYVKAGRDRIEKDPDLADLGRAPRNEQACDSHSLGLSHQNNRI